MNKDTIKKLTDIIADQALQIHELQAEVYRLQKILERDEWSERPTTPPKAPWEPSYEITCSNKY